MSSVSVSLRVAVALAFSVAVVSIATLSAHIVKGIQSPSGATAFVSSPSAATDLPIPVKWGSQPAGDPGLRIVCFYVANTSPARADRPGWPRVTEAGFELPGSPVGFALLEPLDGNWELVEGARATLDGTEVTLDLAIAARINPTGRTPGHPHDPRGIPPGQAAIRGSGTRFCVSGPFPQELVTGQPATIEQFINGVVIGFHGVDGAHRGQEFGVWDNAARVIPLYP
jgi:hypothetical protein